MNEQPVLPGMGASSPPVPSLAEILKTLETARGYLQQRQQQHQQAANAAATPTTAIYHAGMSNALLGEIMIVEQQIMNLRQQDRQAAQNAARQSPEARAGSGCAHPVAKQELQKDGSWRCSNCGAVTVMGGNPDDK